MRHPDIGDDQIGSVGMEVFQRFKTVFGTMDAIDEEGKRTCHGIADAGFVFDVENRDIGDSTHKILLCRA